MKVVTVTVAAALASVVGPAAWAQQCPNGSYPTVDSFGNNICKSISDGRPQTTQVPHGQQCPNGAYPTVDKFGNNICRSMSTPNQPRTDYYDTSKGCPVGMIPSVDSFGNNVCKRF